MKFRQLEAVRAVASTGTTTHGAELIGLTQSAVSRSIKELEDELGMHIFHRRQGKMLLTPEGQLFYKEAEQVILGMERITNMTQDIRALRAGTLRIASMPALSYGMLPDVIAEFGAKYKQVKISVEIQQREALEKSVANGQVDIGLATLPFQADGVELEPLLSMSSVCIIPQSHPLAKKKKNKKVTAEDLTGETFISIDLGTLLRYRIDEVFGKLGISRDMKYEAQSTALICHMVASGVGISIVHPFMAAAFGDRISIHPFEPEVNFDYVLLFPSGQARSLLTKEFSDLIQARSAAMSA
jgi:DNA-binding transcriptional LysR family regulator